MSVQFGSWNFGYRPVEEMDLSPVRALLAPYGPDGRGSYHSEGVDIVYYALHETEESQREEQPCRTATKRVLTWDGRLDNRMDLLRELSEAFPASTPDVAVVAAAYNRWGPGWRCPSGIRTNASWCWREISWGRAHFSTRSIEPVCNGAQFLTRWFSLPDIPFH
jgi:asparagine synthetase B (glutamine-hydrolysing)